MAKYLVLYQWYEFTSCGIIKAENKDEATLKFAENVCKLDRNYTLEKKYGYGGSISPFFYDKDKEETFEKQFNKFLESGEGGTFEVIEITQNIEGVITSKGFYNGQDE